MTRLFTAALLTESSDLSPLPTRSEDWHVVRRADGDKSSFYSDLLAMIDALATERGWQVSESICATAFPPAGRIVQSVYEDLKATIIRDLKKAMPIDGALLLLHGAAMAHDTDDCEGDLLTDVRKITGPDIPVAVELDPHCHITDAMMSSATIMMLYKTFLHTDIKQRAIDLFNLLDTTLKGQIYPTMALANCGALQDFDETHGPMKQLMAKVYELEQQEQVLSISLVRGFPFADVQEAGSKILVVTDNNSVLAESLASDLAKDYAENILKQPSIYTSMNAALNNAEQKAAKGLLSNTLVEVSDAAGYGFGTDSTELLSAMLKRGMSSIAVGLMFDSMAVSICHEVGVGTGLALRVGGKLGKFSGCPLDLNVTVERLYTSHRLTTTHWGDIYLGDVAVLRFGEVELILVSRRVIGYDLQAFRDLGVDPDSKQYVLLKCLCDCDNVEFVIGNSFDPVNWHFSKNRFTGSKENQCQGNG